MAIQMVNIIIFFQNANDSKGFLQFGVPEY